MGLVIGWGLPWPNKTLSWSTPDTNYTILFSYTLHVFAQSHGLDPQVTNVACHCMDHGNNDPCDQCQSIKKINCETIGVNWAQKIEQYTE